MVAPNRVRVTAIDVAKAAGVARSTVSYVLNPDPAHPISPETRERVLAAVRELGYAPSAAARTLRRGRSDIVLALVRDFPIGTTMGRFFYELSEQFAGRGLTFVLHPAVRNARPLSDLFSAITPVAILGFDVFSVYPTADFEGIGMPALELIRDPRPDASKHSPASRLQAQTLLDRGHRRLGVLTVADPRLEGFSGPRTAGVLEVAREAGLPEPDVWALADGDQDYERAINHWLSLDDPVTGVCAYNDDVALGLLAAAQRMGVAVPEQLAVIGLDNIPGGNASTPPLTTVAIDVHAMAQAVVTTAFDVIGTSSGIIRLQEQDVAVLVPRASV